MNLDSILKSIRNKVIVSCQALPGEPLYIEGESIMYMMARAAKRAGTPAIRTNGAHDVAAIKVETGLPVIGLIKKKYPDSEVYITPTMAEVDALIAAGADIIALDCTLRPHPRGQHINDFITEIKSKYPHIPLMADIATFEEGVNAWKCDVALVSTTMSGYTPYSPASDEPDFDLVKKLSQAVDIPVIAEGRVHEPVQVKKLLDCGAYAVVVGGAITRPLEIAERFIRAADEDGA